MGPSHRTYFYVFHNFVFMLCLGAWVMSVVNGISRVFSDITPVSLRACVCVKGRRWWGSRRGSRAQTTTLYYIPSSNYNQQIWLGEAPTLTHTVAPTFGSPLNLLFFPLHTTTRISVSSGSSSNNDAAASFHIVAGNMHAAGINTLTSWMLVGFYQQEVGRTEREIVKP